MARLGLSLNAQQGRPFTRDRQELVKHISRVRTKDFGPVRVDKRWRKPCARTLGRPSLLISVLLQRSHFLARRQARLSDVPNSLVGYEAFERRCISKPIQWAAHASSATDIN